MPASLMVPNSNVTLFDGSVVILHRFPDTKWIVHQSWYSYEGANYNGWYFSSIPQQTIIPMNEEDLSSLTIVSGGPGYCPDMPYPPIPGPFPPAPGPFPPLPVGDLPAYISNDEKARYEAAFITLPLLADRDALNTEKLPDGKIVRVNNVNDEAKYFIWNKYEGEWQDFVFPTEEPEPQPEPISDILYVMVDTSEETIQLSSSYDEMLTAIETNRLPVLIHIDDMLYYQQKLDNSTLQFSRLNFTQGTVTASVIEIDESDNVETYMLNISAQIAE